MDKMAQLSVRQRGKLGSFVPPMRSGCSCASHLMRIVLPDEIFVAELPFKSGRDAVPTLLARAQPDFRLGDTWSTVRILSSIREGQTFRRYLLKLSTIEVVETECMSLTDDHDDEIIVIELLRRTMEEQFAADLAYDKDLRAFHFCLPEPSALCQDPYRSLKEMTSATVVELYPDRKRPERINNVRHHAFAPRFERIGYHGGTFRSRRPSSSVRTGRAPTVSPRRCSPARRGWIGTDRCVAKYRSGGTYWHTTMQERIGRLLFSTGSRRTVPSNSCASRHWSRS